MDHLDGVFRGLKRSEASEQFLSQGADRRGGATSGHGVCADVAPVSEEESERERVAVAPRAIQPLQKSL